MTSLWARLAVDYYRNPKILEVGPLAELAWIRLIALARETMPTSKVDGAVAEVLVLREIRDITDLHIASTTTPAESLLDVLEAARLITRQDGLVIVNDYTEWQTSQEELHTFQRKTRRA